MTARNQRTTTTLRRRALAVGLMSALAATSCSVGLDTLPLPAPSVGSSGYSVTVTFANALNLPAKAAVKLNGADIGQVDTMRARDFAAVVTLRIRSGVVLPAGTTAELRSATPMGDVFVALTPPAQPGPEAATLHDGSAIPMTSTSQAATIEDLLSRAALLVNGGAIRDLTKVVNGLGAEFGGRGDHLAELIAETTDLVRTLSQRSDQIRAAIRDTDALTATVAARQSTVNDAVAAAGPGLAVVGANTQNVVDLVARLDQIAGELGKFPSVNGTGTRSLVTDINNLAAGLNTAANDPNANLDGLLTTIGIVGGKVMSSSAGAADADIHQIEVGTVPGPDFPANPEARPPGPTDWANFVGSLAYTLQRLHDRVTGPGR